MDKGRGAVRTKLAEQGLGGFLEVVYKTIACLNKFYLLQKNRSIAIFQFLLICCFYISFLLFRRRQMPVQQWGALMNVLPRLSSFFRISALRKSFFTIVNRYKSVYAILLCFLNSAWPVPSHPPVVAGCAANPRASPLS
jgi:hypothetical protein